MSFQIENTAFINGDFARWIRDYQQRNPDTISFSNSVKKMNEQGVKIVTLSPLTIESGDASTNDMENLANLENYFNYIVDTINDGPRDTVTVMVGTDVYSLTKSIEDGNNIIRVIKVSGESVDLEIE